jgi:thiol-disulfide isomerase/thioredoxin
MQFKILGFAIGIAVLAFIGVTFVMIKHATKPDMPPMVGAVSKFKPANPPVPVPPGSFVDADGHTLNLTAFKGKLTLVNFWATWCTPCVAELPSIDRLKRAKSSGDFDVETISEDQGGQIAVVDFFKKDGIVALPLYVDTAAAFSESLKLNGLPTTLLLAPDGRELGRYEGDTDWNSPDAYRLFDWYLAREKPAPGEAKPG